MAVVEQYDRPMAIRGSATVILALLAGVAMAAVAQGQHQGAGTEASRVPNSERTYPQIHPAFGNGRTAFTLTFTLRDAPGHEGVIAVEYRVQVTAPLGGGSSCMASQPPAIDSGTAGASEMITLTPPARGWCRGIYRVTVFLQRGPYCPPQLEGQPPTPCPEFASQELDTGSTSFTVGPRVPARASVPNLIGLKPATADRRLKRRHLRVRYTALSNLCAGVPPHGRIIVQEPAAGTKVPRGSTVLVQTSCRRNRSP
jgi:hypothetical protein